MSDVAVIHGDMRDVLGKMIAEGKVVQAVVTDPPYHLTSIVKRFGSETAAPAKVGQTGAYARASTGFMGKQWDGGDIAFLPGTWRLCYDLLPPGGHLLAFAGTRTYHRMAVAIEEAGFEIRDSIAWLYGSGFPKSHSVSKAIDRAAGAEREIIGRSNRDLPKTKFDGLNGGAFQEKPGMGEFITAPATDAARQWDGWGTALKPAMELICVARKPLDRTAEIHPASHGAAAGPDGDRAARRGTIAANVLAHGTGALNIDGCRVATDDALGGGDQSSKTKIKPEGWDRPWMQDEAAKAAHAERVNGNVAKAEALGRWPANVCHDGSDEVVSAFPETNSTRANGNPNNPINGAAKSPNAYAVSDGRETHDYRDLGSAARFFYSTKPDEPKGRWPANVCHDGSDEVVRTFPESNSGGDAQPGNPERGTMWAIGAERSPTPGGATFGDSGSAARFFYSSKADAGDRLGSKHPTVKPTDLCRWLVRLVTPPGGTVLDPFAGSGTTGMACMAEGFDCIMVEREAEYVKDIRTRIAHVHGEDTPLFGGQGVSERPAGRQIYGEFNDKSGILGKQGKLL